MADNKIDALNKKPQPTSRDNVWRGDCEISFN